MTVAIVLASLCALAVILCHLARGTPDASPTSAPMRSPGSRRRPGKPHFSGRRVEPESAIASILPVTQTKRRMVNGRKVAAVKNGQAVIPPDAIGLGCLQPISECSLGDRCICLGQSEPQTGSRL